jgi:hypothetical protein
MKPYSFSMHLLRIGAAALALVAGGAFANAASARPQARFFLDGAATVEVPIGDGDYTGAYWPSPQFGLHLGAEVWLRPHLGLAPEFAIDGGPVLDKRANPTTGRLRFQPGLRVLFGFGRGHAFFLRWLIGADLIIYGPGGSQGQGTVDPGFVTTPGLGMQFRVARHAVIGFLAGVPVALHSYGAPSTHVNADFETGFFIGYRR